eukprot:13273311-Alexandrium_andersonii.AAC.1
MLASRDGLLFSLDTRVGDVANSHRVVYGWLRDQMGGTASGECGRIVRVAPCVPVVATAESYLCVECAPVRSGLV